MGWIYGLNQFIEDLDSMELPIRRYMGMANYLKFGIKYASPVVLAILIVVDIYDNDDVRYHGLGLHLHSQEDLIPIRLLTIASVIFWPIFAGWEIRRYWRSEDQDEVWWRKLFRPTRDWFELIRE